MAKHKDFKKPRTKNTPHIQIRAVETQQDYDLSKPIFSLRHIEYGGRNCISQCVEEKKALILDALLRLSQILWKDIKRLPKEVGFEPMPRHRFSVPVPIPPNLTPESTILVARYDGDGGRLAGYRDNDVYHVVLVGRDLYPH